MAKVLRGFIIAAMLLIVMAFAGMLVPRPLIPHSEMQAVGPSQDILIIANPIHTDIAIPVTPETRVAFGFLRDAGVPIDHPDARWIIFGWGGRSFYLETPTWADLKPGPAFKALTLDRAVMHVEAAGEINLASPDVTRLSVSAPGYAALLGFIRESFVEEGGAPVAINGYAYGSADSFFEARGRFNVLVGCNTWSAAALRHTGLQTGWWNPLPASLSVSLSLYN